MRLIIFMICSLASFSALADSTHQNQNSVSETEITWNRAIEILNEGNVVRLTQSHNLWVGLLLDDGSRFTTQAPEIDAIFEEVKACEKCGRIPMVTE